MSNQTTLNMAEVATQLKALQIQSQYLVNALPGNLISDPHSPLANMAISIQTQICDMQAYFSLASEQFSLVDLILQEHSEDALLMFYIKHKFYNVQPQFNMTNAICYWFNSRGYSIFDDARTQAELASARMQILEILRRKFEKHEKTI